MTDFAAESTGFSSLTPQTFWVSTSPTPLPSRPARVVTVLPAQSSAASLAAATQHLLESMVTKRVPRLEKLRLQLDRAGLGAGLAEIEDAVHHLHQGMGALDFLGGRHGGDQASEFVEQGAALSAASERLATLATHFTERHAIEGPVARLVWIELVLESRSLHKRVRQGAHWMAQLDRDLRTRRAAAASSDVTQRALGELSRRAQALHERLQMVHRLCGHVRSVHTVCEQLAGLRDALCATLQDKVLPARQQLHGALQPLLDAAAYRPLVPEELMAAIEARHELQVALTQAGAEIIRLQASRDELASQLAWMEDKARRLA